ncbi:hypothetical protein EB796_023726 [Bugula neritina]|uniref:Anoctamin n=1 Tax=Bugula neritina TaxID=10212 RepID=A0A7J7IWP1_BUGNE|nr:hypothetical protein EB796_023726 [Bugula neritina]
MPQPHPRDVHHVLPPIGFEELTQAPVKPLKKKKRRARNKLNTLLEASAQFRHTDRGVSVEDPPPELVSRGDNSRHPEASGTSVQLRRSKRSKSERSEKRFTVSDFEKAKPEWLRQKTLQLGQTMTGMQEEGSDSVKDLLRKLYTAPERDRIDYVLIYNIPKDPDSKSEKRKAILRRRFEELLKDEGFSLEHEELGNTVFCKLHCSFRRLCKEAEAVKLQMPLTDMEIADDDEDNALTQWIEKKFGTDDEVDFVSAPFEQAKLHLYQNCESPDLFFRSSLRGLLADHCLKNLDMRNLPETPQYYYHMDDEMEDDPATDILAKQGLPYLLMKGVYDDAFILHDESADNVKESEKFNEGESKGKEQEGGFRQEALQSVLSYFGDSRHDLNVTWPNVLKFQPLWKIRNYFGEEIALYFAWVGLFILSIFLPMLFGLAVFGYGMYCSLSGNCEDVSESIETASINGTTTTIGFVESSLLLLDTIKEAFDNEATPFYAATICVWSTIFMELWKRKNAVLAYEWDVKDFESSEPDRPSYYGTDTMKDPITQEDIQFYPFKYKCVKYTMSFFTFLTMVCVVFAILASVTLYRVIMIVDYCAIWDADSPLYCFLVTTIGSSVLNAVAILILGKIYEKLAHILTDWENHRTGSAYRNALIIKLFAFQFANCYSSLYYIAFFRSFSSFDSYGYQTAASSTERCVAAVSISYKVDPEKSEETDPDDYKSKFLEAEKNKPPLQDFTLNEYTEKVIQYGFIVLFAAAMPLGPLIAVLVNTLDRYVDSKRILWMYRRPVPIIAQDIGMWQYILDFLSFAAVITNAFLIAYVSKWGIRNFGVTGTQLWAVLVFEHVVLILKYILAVAIPDVPHRIRIAMRKEKYTVAKILETGAFVKKMGSNDPNKYTVSSIQRLTPEVNTQVDKTNFDTVTTRNVDLESRGPVPRQRHPYPAPDYTDAGDVGGHSRTSTAKGQATRTPQTSHRTASHVQNTPSSSALQSASLYTQPTPPLAQPTPPPAQPTPLPAQPTPPPAQPTPLPAQPTPLPKQHSATVRLHTPNQSPPSPRHTTSPARNTPQPHHPPSWTPEPPPQSDTGLQKWDQPDTVHQSSAPSHSQLYQPTWTPDPSQSGQGHPSSGNISLTYGQAGSSYIK